MSSYEAGAVEGADGVELELESRKVDTGILLEQLMFFLERDFETESAAALVAASENESVGYGSNTIAIAGQTLSH